MAWNDYLYTGDYRSAQHFYEKLTARTLLGLQDSTGFISTKNDNLDTMIEINYNFYRKIQDIVDWPHPRMWGSQKVPGETDGFVFTDYNAVTNAYHYRTLVIMKEIATALGKTKDAKIFASKASELKENYYHYFWDKKRSVYCDGITTRHASLHTNMFALLAGLVKDEDVKEVLSFIKERGMACSVYGSQFLLEALYNYGEEKYALDLITAKTDRSWYNMLKAGATITMEAWDNKYKPNLDWNHAWGAAAGNIISRKLMGIEALNPGWTELKIEPKPADLEAAQITVPTIKGSISMSFVNSPDSFKMDTALPANTTAQIFLPVKSGKIVRVLQNSREIKFSIKNGRIYIKNIQSGSHHFIVEYKY